MPATLMNANSKNPLRGAVEIIPDRLFYCALKAGPTSSKVTLRDKHNKKVSVHFFNIDNDLVYWNFFLDFGPLNLGQLYRFSQILKEKLDCEDYDMICFYSAVAPAKRANAIYLICAWQLLYLGRSPEEAAEGFRFYQDEADPKNSEINHSHSNGSLPPPSPLTSIGQNTIRSLPPFHDASPCACNYELNLMHCLKGLEKAIRFKLFDWDKFNVEEYEHFEQVENGDLNWIIDGKILAFAGPSYQRTVTPEGYCTLSPLEYIPYFSKKNVALVVRLNKKLYDEQDFIRAGIKHLDSFYLDGSVPTMDILHKVIHEFEQVPEGKAFAVHCKAGLGRTGTCIGAYIMKHYMFTAAEAIAWMRICRPGMVIGPQQTFLENLQPIMWQEGETMRSRPGAHDFGYKSKPQISNTESSLAKLGHDAVVGREGQADGLLSRRHKSKGNGKKDGKPAPVTPDEKGLTGWVKSS